MLTLPVDAPVTKEFGTRPATPSSPPAHLGIDFGAPFGTPIYATADGVVTASRRSTALNGGYGEYIWIDHGMIGRESLVLTTLSAHLSRRLVVKGQPVRRGQLIGFTGATGNVTGPHLHFETREAGQFVDPRVFLDFSSPAGGKPPTPIRKKHTRSMDTYYLVGEGDLMQRLYAQRESDLKIRHVKPESGAVIIPQLNTFVKAQTERGNPPLVVTSDKLKALIDDFGTY